MTLLGLNTLALKQYHTWEKIATIIYEGKEVRVMAGLTQIHKRAKRD